MSPMLLLSGSLGVGLVTAAIVILKYRRDRKWRKCDIQKDLSGQTAVITGASSGLGREIALELVRRNARVILACRDVAKGRTAIAYIFDRIRRDARFDQRANGDSDDVKVMQLDLSCLDSITSFATCLRERVSSVDILVNNAAIMGAPFAVTRSGFETHFGVNHFGHFALTRCLEELLASSNVGGRVVTVTSGYYKKIKSIPCWESSKFEQGSTTDLPPGYNGIKAYAISKLANCLHTIELAERWPNSETMKSLSHFNNSTSFRACAVRPGFVRGTELGRHFNRILSMLAFPIIWFVSQNVHQGVQTILHCCLSDELKSGALYHNCQAEDYAELVTKDNSKQLWDFSEKYFRKAHTT